MARKHRNIPVPQSINLDKATLLRTLVGVDRDPDCSRRALSMESDFRSRITSHLAALPQRNTSFQKLGTSPFVLLFYALKNGLTRISEIEAALLPAKVFSSMETSAGRMVEAVVLPQYGWNPSPSRMHTETSIIDGTKMSGDTLCVATLKSGPRCLNDEMSANFADDILDYSVGWARARGVAKIDFTYGSLYGTPAQSNKKDWHILRNIADKYPEGLLDHPKGRWWCRFEKLGVEVTVTVRIGVELWSYIAGHDTALVEIGTALLRACVAPCGIEEAPGSFETLDLGAIVSLENVPPQFNVKILQRSQLEWLFLFARHFCDALQEGDMAALAAATA